MVHINDHECVFVYTYNEVGKPAVGGLSLTCF